MRQFVKVPVAGPASLIDFHDDSETSVMLLLRGIVGGYIQAVGLDRDHVLYLNEDGKRLGLPRNATATRIAKGHIRADDFIAGDAVIVGPTDGYGDSTSVDLAFLRDTLDLEIVDA